MGGECGRNGVWVLLHPLSPHSKLTPTLGNACLPLCSCHNLAMVAAQLYLAGAMRADLTYNLLNFWCQR